jgi:acetylornithine deacetylase/succinyl-diaminopimelate desuccinylase-like protein
MDARIVAWLQRLVQIPSVNPAHAGPTAQTTGEGALVTVLAQIFRDLDADEIVYDPVLPKRDNIYAIWHGTDPAVALLDVHLDTVGVEQMTIDPFGGDVRDGRVYGRGAVDTKASLAVALAVIEAQVRSGASFAQTIMIACTVDEEELGSGAIALAAWLRRRKLHPKTMIVAEPTECRPVYGHTGLVRLWVHTHGVAVHTSQPDRGRNAIAAMLPIVNAYIAEHQRLQTTAPAALGHGALTVSLIDGGRGMNIVPDACRIGIDRRVVDGESAADVQRHLEALAAEASDDRATFTFVTSAEAFYQDPTHPWVTELCAFHQTSPATAPYGTNAFAYGDIPECCVVYGPGSIAQAHTEDEWVSLAELNRAAAWYRHWWRVGSEPNA